MDSNHPNLHYFHSVAVYIHMMNVFIYVVSLLSLIGNWIPFTPLNNHFMVMFPGIPVYKEESIDTQVGVVLQTKYSLSALDERQNFQFELVEIEYPKGLIIDDSTGFLLVQTIKEELLTNLAGTLLYSQAEPGNDQGNEIFLIKYKQTLCVKSKCYWKNNTFFSLLVYTDYEGRLKPFSEKFFQSFQIL